MVDIAEGTICLLQFPGESHYDSLVAETPWEQKSIKIFGREIPQPRLTAWYGDSNRVYSYSGASFRPLPFTPRLDAIRESIETLTGANFNSVLLNWYRDGSDSIGFHSDNEPELGSEPVIASLSYGATRNFIFKHRRKSYPNVVLPLSDGDLLIMAGATQKNWLHGVNKLKPTNTGFDQGRINLTFRYIR